MPEELLTRDQFREAVFARDSHRCVSCGNPGQDAHHIIERRLFGDGGYYLSNGATLCGDCHLRAEATTLTVEEIRSALGLQHHLCALPGHLYPDTCYDKWGNPVLGNGMRLRGELFGDESVQKVLSPVLHLFTSKVKYPRTYHLPWSPGFTDDDRVLSVGTIENWKEREVVITEKMDGENTTLYRDGLHARSLDYEPHPTRDRIKAIHALHAHDIPDGWRICAENLTAKHSIAYNHLPDYLMVFSIWDNLTCLPWSETVLYTEVMGLHSVPVIYQGPFLGESHVTQIVDRYRKSKSFPEEELEGYVIRPAGAFTMREFPTRLGKYVRKNHVQTHGHWMRSRIDWNGVANEPTSSGASHQGSPTPVQDEPAA